MKMTMVEHCLRHFVVLCGCFLIASSLAAQTTAGKGAPSKSANEAKVVEPAPAQPASAAEGATKPHDDTFVIGDDDVLAINVWKEPDISRSIPVRSDGRISLPLAGEIQAAGRTPLALEREIADKLKSYISEPEVTVMVQQINSQKYNILGQVTKPGFLRADQLCNCTRCDCAGRRFPRLCQEEVRLHSAAECRRHADAHSLQLQGSAQRRESRAEHQTSAPRHDRCALRVIMLTRLCLTLALLIATPLVWAQTDSNGNEPASPLIDSTMLTPPPVSGQSYPAALGSEERSNFLRYGLSFNSAYSDNALGGSTPMSDVSYSIWPTIALDQKTTTLHTVLSYAPGFTFYQRSTSRDEADQNFSIHVSDRLSPHVTLSAGDGLQKSSSVFNQLDYGSGGVSGGAGGGNSLVIAPVSPFLHNTGNIDLSYQFAANGMIGASGTFTNLHYSNSDQVTGLADSNTQGGSVFYSLRASRLHYFGVTYQYQRLVSSSATVGQSETQTHAILFYYTLYPTSTLSISFFGGPQHSNTSQAPLGGLQLPPAVAWNPSIGGSVSWQGQLTNVAFSYSHAISGGGGLSGAVHSDSANLSLRRRITRTLDASLSGGYAQNNVLGSPLFGGSNNGHSYFGDSVAVETTR